MSIALEATLIAVLAALAIGLVPLLFQLRRSAQNFDAFLLASRRDLAQITEDVHASRLRMDHLVGSLKVSMDQLSTFAQAMGEVGHTVKDFHARFRSTIDSASRNLGAIIGAISGLMAFFKSKQQPSQQE